MDEQEATVERITRALPGRWRVENAVRCVECTTYISPREHCLYCGFAVCQQCRPDVPEGPLCWCCYEESMAR